MLETKLVLNELTKNYGEFVALSPTSFDVNLGEFVTLLGPSGSGKTTLLMAIAGLTSPSGGKILVDGKDTTHMPVYDRDIGMVFQNYALFPHLDVFENIAFPLRMRRLAEDEIKKRTKNALEMIQLDRLAKRYPKELSGGQQQRVAIARALIYEPSIVLMDEPLGALDKRLREQMQFEIKKIHDDLKLTILYVTHDQEEALSMSDRICLMNGGKVEQLSSPKDMYFYPHTQFAANFLGEANIVQCTSTAPFEVKMPRGELVKVRKVEQQSAEIKSILIRPESFHLTDPARVDHANMLHVEIKDIALLGPLTRLVLRYGDMELIAKIQTSSEIARLQRGMPTAVTFAVADTIVLPES